MYEAGYDLVHSPDDGGWYWERWATDSTSQLFDDKEAAIAAFRDGSLLWDVPDDEEST